MNYAMQQDPSFRDAVTRVQAANPATADAVLQQGDTIDLADLQGGKFIGFDQDIPTRKALDQFFREQRIELEPSMEFDNIETLKRAVEVDAGVALVPEGTIRQEVEQGTLVMLRLRDRRVARPLAILHRKGGGDAERVEAVDVAARR